VRRAVVAAVLVACALVSTPAVAFWEVDSDAVYGELRGFVRGAVLFAENPDEPLLYADSSDGRGEVAARLLGELEVEPWLSLQANLHYAGSTTTAGAVSAPTGGLRSSLLSWSLRENPSSRHRLDVDRLALRVTLGAESSHPVDVRIGRLPVNLATTFYFVPNDFFAPFAASTFFRAYKPGVDAARVDVQLWELTQLSAIAVAGYEDEQAEPTWARSSGLVRLSTSLADLEWVALGGVVGDRGVAGGSFQGEVFEWLGVRGEGHYAWGRDRRDNVEVAVGVDRRFASTLTVRVEQFFHSAGYDRPGRYARALAEPDRAGLYLGRHYTALGAGYELTPLVVADTFVLVNGTDSSALVGVNLLVSLSDEAEVAVTTAIPWGRRPMLPASVGSEFGLYPATASVDFRAWF
jgi:hypothetical protein